MASEVEIIVNGARRRVNAAERTLLSVLREDLDLTGAKYGCGEGQCGACTVLVDGKAVRSCITQASAVAGKQVTTIEGLEKDGRLDPVQEAFLTTQALQCGYCTPGMIMSSVALLKQTPKPTEAQIAKYLEGNICRCGTYPRIVAAVRLAGTNGKGGSRG
jgi:aerobic-type carbon monoxide dehydrogenase small subunit (CoxS/CutS family)